ncbi:streptophobe family protein [Kitasatospora mediocidica]|uniref:streptophobe family protein n=1 Tax=Kitasatospora mediocidica TaxID=58352 RepID=UPI00056BC792|nr:streptophobe family protein [Kitasatospora mediocidica]
MRPSDGPPDAAHPHRPPAGWLEALATAVATLVVMAAVAALGLWSAGATGLPSGSFLPVVAATVLSAQGIPLQLDGDAGFLAQASASIDVVPLSVTLVGALVLGWVFLWPLRLRAVLTPGELAARALRTALFWAAALLLLTRLARHSFSISTGSPEADLIGGALGITPTVGFHAAWAAALGYGLLWLVVVLLLAFVVARRAPLPSALLRRQLWVRPAAHGVLLVLLAYVLLGLVAAFVVVIRGTDARDTLALVLLGLPNLVWIALGVGLGGSWHGRVTGGSIGLPVPEPLASVLGVGGDKEAVLDLSSLAQQDGRAWLLLPLAAVVVLGAGVLSARQTAATAVPGGGVSPWQHAVRMAVALGAALLVVGLLTRIAANYGLSFLGVGDLTGPAAAVALHCDLLVTVAAGGVWGALAGFVGALTVRGRRRR